MVEVTRVKRTAVPELAPFSKVDWYGWAGAERFTDGGEPFIAYADVLDWPEDMVAELDIRYEERVVTVIVDATGVSIWGVNAGYTLDLSDRDLALAVANRLLALPISAAVLVALGFQPYNLPEVGS